jgi:hypothetical protein
MLFFILYARKEQHLSQLLAPAPTFNPSQTTIIQGRCRVTEQRTQLIDMAASALNPFVVGCLLALVIASDLD